MTKFRSGNNVITSKKSAASAGAFFDMKGPKGDSFRVVSKEVSDEGKRRASKVIRDGFSRQLDSRKAKA